MMTPEMAAKLKRSLILHEGFRKFPYLDSVGKTTIGIGYNLSDRGIGEDWINNQYDKDVEYFYAKLQIFPWFKDLNPDRQIALIDMCFFGWQKFLGFKNLIDALSIHDYSNAAIQMLDSKWALQTKTRAATLAQVMLTGIYDI